MTNKYELIPIFVGLRAEPLISYHTNYGNMQLTATQSRGIFFHTNTRMLTFHFHHTFAL